ncbi:alpha/beta hydrolase [uncultured Microbacterium sp.]|uniref:alpha/beta fold hydrolase n=1 Tax=uncultured Microbacterium sp. TaxID=191216 RepID=UPI0028D1BDAB|nr:alpha/beta hydrolase [uncultured Microbacterium sp.]
MASSPLARRTVVGAILVATAFLSACTSPPQSIAPANLDIVCEGEGTPTVILIPGLDTPADTFESLQAQIATDTHVCSYSRAGIGTSPPWPEDLPDPSAGTAADQLRATLEANEVSGPFVVLGWSYGGLVTQAFAARHPDAVAGLIFEDSSMMGQFENEIFDPSSFVEGGRSVDLDGTAEEIEGLSLEGLPVIVLTEGIPPEGIDGATLEWYTQLHDDLSALSDDSLHVIAVDAGHAIHWDSEALVEKAVGTVVDAVRSGDAMSECDDTVWVPYGGECRVG